MLFHLFVYSWRFFNFLLDIKHNAVVSHFLVHSVLSQGVPVFLINMYSLLQLFWNMDTILVSPLPVVILDFWYHPYIFLGLCGAPPRKYRIIEKLLTLGIFCNLHWLLLLQVKNPLPGVSSVNPFYHKVPTLSGLPLIRISIWLMGESIFLSIVLVIKGMI